MFENEKKKTTKDNRNNVAQERPTSQNTTNITYKNCQAQR